MKAVCTLLSLFLLLAAGYSAATPVVLVPGLPGLDEVRTSAFPGETISIVCHRPAESGHEPPRARLFVAGSATAAPLEADIRWEETAAASADTPYQSFIAELTAPEVAKPLDLLLRVNAFPGDQGIGTVRIHLSPKRLPGVFRSLTATRTLWVEEDWTSLRIWLDAEDIPYEVLPVSGIPFRNGDFLLARLPVEEKERIRETESLGGCPEQLWIETGTGDGVGLRVSRTDTATKVIARIENEDPFPPRGPSDESPLLAALAPFFSSQP